MPYKCPKKQRASQNNTKAHTRKVLTILKLISGCKICGFNKYPTALEFDHLDPSKKSFELSNFGGRGLKRVLEETRKCQILCSNCHKELTHRNKQHLTMQEV